MPPRISKVRWTADNVPWGIDIDTRTGKFTGIPEAAGEYIVPVTVETNYGTDTKNVKIIVELPTYGVYSIGAKAATWSDGGTPNADGFYGLNMPKAYELVQHYNGFGALTAGHKYYCCGCFLPKRKSYTSIYTHDKTLGIMEAVTPIDLYEQIISELGSSTVENAKRILSGVDRVIYVYSTASVTLSGTTREDRTQIALVYWNSSLAESFVYPTLLKRVSTTSGVPYEYWEIPRTDYNIKNVSPENGKTALDDKSYVTNSISYLSDDNTKWGYLTTHFDLGYTAIKPFDGTLFRALSESHYLDNNPDNFTHGTIKDAWVYRNAVYVQTTSNQLYSYVSGTKTWDLAGMYDIKKIELPNASSIFLLTKDGELYHKGSAVTGLFDTTHETLTRVFPALTFKDFTFGGNTLTVLRE